LGGGGVVRRKCSAGPLLPLWAGKTGFGVLHFKGDAILLPFWKIDNYNVTIFSAVP